MSTFWRFRQFDFTSGYIVLRFMRARKQFRSSEHIRAKERNLRKWEEILQESRQFALNMMIYEQREREMISSIEEIEKIRMMETKIWKILKEEY